MVAGLTRYAHAKRWNGLRHRFKRLYEQMLMLPMASNHGLYQCESTNLCYRRSTFLSHRGFADHANLIAGATEIMVNNTSRGGNVALALSPESFMLQDCPESRMWEQDHLYAVETRRYYNHWVLYRLQHGLGVWTDRLYRIALLGSLALECWAQQWVLAAVTGVLALVHIIFRSHEWHRTTSIIGERSMHLTLPLLIALVPWWDNKTWFKWLFTNKKTFRKKFV